MLLTPRRAYYDNRMALAVRCARLGGWLDDYWDDRLRRAATPPVRR